MLAGAMTRSRLDRLRLVRRAVPALLVLGVAAAARAQTTLEELVRHRPADSLVVPLRRFENEARRPADGARAAMLLGQLYYARGEYRPAAEAFSRAAARLDPAHKPEARYWMGLAWLALGDAGQARAVENPARRASSATAWARGSLGNGPSSTTGVTALGGMSPARAASMLRG